MNNSKKMEVIVHRVNNLSKLHKIPKNYGIEVDVRDYKNKLILNHDPFKDGESFESLLKNYEHGTLIINVKSEFIELRIIRLLNKYKVKKYFFLDSSYPVMIKFNKYNNKNFAIRVSDYESVKNIYKFKNTFKWIWLEIFKKVELSKKDLIFIKKNNIKICLVSPELHNNKNYLNIIKFIKSNKIQLHSVCTKNKKIKFWERVNF